MLLLYAVVIEYMILHAEVAPEKYSYRNAFAKYSQKLSKVPVTEFISH